MGNRVCTGLLATMVGGYVPRRQGCQHFGFPRWLNAGKAAIIHTATTLRSVITKLALYPCGSVEMGTREYLADEMEVASWNLCPEPNWRH